MNNGIKRGTQICVYTENSLLFQKIKLEFLGISECVMCTDTNAPDGEICLVDIDCPKFKDKRGVRMSYYDEGADLSLPFRMGSLKELILGESGSNISIDEDGGCVRLGGKIISLTDVEMALFKAIYSRGGEFASRDEILNEVWAGARDGGVINVYVHYLREKLECDGEKIILSSRKNGYAISKKYVGGGENA